MQTTLTLFVSAVDPGSIRDLEDLDSSVSYISQCRGKSSVEEGCRVVGNMRMEGGELSHLRVWLPNDLLVRGSSTHTR